MPRFESKGGEWTKIADTDETGPPQVLPALSLPVRHLQRKQLSEGKITIKPNPPKPVQAGGQPEGVSNAKLDQRGRNMETVEGKDSSTGGRGEGSSGPQDIRGGGSGSEVSTGRGEAESSGDAIGPGPASDKPSPSVGDDSQRVHGNEQASGADTSGAGSGESKVRSDTQKPTTKARRKPARRTRTKSS